MELLLAIVVASAVIFFGALISTGNERQRKAIDNLREQVALWAVQDIRIKREGMARNIQISDPLVWLNNIASHVCGHDLSLHVVEVIPDLRVIICDAAGDIGKVIFTPFAPAEIQEMKRAKNSQLTTYSNLNPLLSIPKNVSVYECSVLRNGFLFDVELPLAWKGLTGIDTNNMDRMWMYMVP